MSSFSVVRKSSLIGAQLILKLIVAGSPLKEIRAAFRGSTSPVYANAYPKLAFSLQNDDSTVVTLAVI